MIIRCSKCGNHREAEDADLVDCLVTPNHLICVLCAIYDAHGHASCPVCHPQGWK